MDFRRGEKWGCPHSRQTIIPRRRSRECTLKRTSVSVSIGTRRFGIDDAPYAAISSRQLSTCVTDMRKDFGTRIMGVAVSIASLRFTNEILGELNASSARSRCETADRANRSNFQTITTDASASAHPDLSRGDPRRSLPSCRHSHSAPILRSLKPTFYSFDGEGERLVDVRGIEPLTPCLQSKIAVSISSVLSLGF